METPWRLHGNSIEFYGGTVESLWSCMEFAWNLHGTLWSFMELHGTCMELCGVSWSVHNESSKSSKEVSCNFHGVPQRRYGVVMVASIEFHGVPSMELSGVSKKF